MNKFCRACESDKDINEFSLKDKQTGKRQSYCKLCQNVRSKDHYRHHKKDYLKRAKDRGNVDLIQIRIYVWDYLSTHPCVDCGESDPIVLEFDHMRDKKHNVSELIRSRSNLQKVILEIEKCVIRCANCHRRKTSLNNNWKHKYSLVSSIE